MHSYEVRLEKIRSNHDNLRTDFVEGFTSTLPTIGNVFTMASKGLEFGMRLIQTSPILSVERIKDEFVFQTVNSLYKLEILNYKDYDDNIDLALLGE